MMTHKPSRDAFTVIEVLIVVLIACLVSSSIWSLFTAGNRSFEQATSQTSALRSASLAIEYVRRDLGRLATVRPRPPFDDVPAPVLAPKPCELSFRVLVPPAPGRFGSRLGGIETEPVIYRFVKRGLRGHGLYRNGTRISGVHLERFEASVVSDPVSGARFLRLAVTGSDPGGTRRVFVRDLILLEQLENVRRHGSSVPNAYPAILVPAPNPTV